MWGVERMSAIVGLWQLLYSICVLSLPVVDIVMFWLACQTVDMSKLKLEMEELQRQENEWKQKEEELRKKEKVCCQ